MWASQFKFSKIRHVLVDRFQDTRCYVHTVTQVETEQTWRHIPKPKQTQPPSWPAFACLCLFFFSRKNSNTQMHKIAGGVTCWPGFCQVSRGMRPSVPIRVNPSKITGIAFQHFLVHICGCILVKCFIFTYVKGINTRSSESWLREFWHLCGFPQTMLECSQYDWGSDLNGLLWLILRCAVKNWTNHRNKKA